MQSLTGRAPRERPKITRLPADVRCREIVDTAFAFIAEHGFENLRTRDIASCVGINSATLHHHFPTKSDLISAVADKLAKGFRSEKSAPAKVGVSPPDALRAQFQDARFYRQSRPEFLAVYREFVTRAPRDPQIAELVSELNGEWLVDVRAIIVAGTMEGFFRADLDPDAISALIVTTIWGSVSSAAPGTAALDRQADELLKLLAANPPDRNAKRRRSAARRA